MYSIKNLINKEPVSLSAAIIGIINFLVIVGSIHVSATTIASGNTALVLLLGLFVRSQSTPTVVAASQAVSAADAASIKTTNDIHTFLSSVPAAAPVLPVTTPAQDPTVTLAPDPTGSAGEPRTLRSPRRR